LNNKDISNDAPYNELLDHFENNTDEFNKFLTLLKDE
jgi:hypothetical protein